MPIVLLSNLHKTYTEAIYCMLKKVRSNLIKIAVVRVIWSIDPDVPLSHEWLYHDEGMSWGRHAPPVVVVPYLQTRFTYLSAAYVSWVTHLSSEVSTLWRLSWRRPRGGHILARILAYRSWLSRSRCFYATDGSACLDMISSCSVPPKTNVHKSFQECATILLV